MALFAEVSLPAQVGYCGPEGKLQRQFSPERQLIARELSEANDGKWPTAVLWHQMINLGAVSSSNRHRVQSMPAPAATHERADHCCRNT